MTRLVDRIEGKRFAHTSARATLIRAVSFLAFAILLAPLCADAAREGVKVTSQNLGQFRALTNSKPFYACNSLTGTLGSLNHALSAGALWNAASAEEARRSIRGLQKKLEKLKRKKGKRSKAYKGSASKLAAVRRVLGDIERLASSCSAPAPEEFVGDARSLTPYRDKLTRAEVRHLLDKVAFGGSAELEELGVSRGLGALVDALMTGLGGPEEIASLERDAAYWSSLGYFYFEGPEYAGVRIWNMDALHAGQYYRFIFSRHPLREWMMLLLSGHFATNLDDLDFSYTRHTHFGIPAHWSVLKEEALGNFGRLAKRLLSDPAMNFWLDNKDNQSGKPNQNFARELMELFTLGAADPVTGLPNYDEDSVAAATSFVSGFVESSQSDPETGEQVIAIGFDGSRHDSEPRTLFRGVAGAEVSASMTAEQLIEHILFQHPGSPRFLAERFAGQMLYPGLPDSIVRELASDLSSGNYELAPFVRKILLSSAMFSGASREPCLSSPIESIVSLARRVLTKPLPKDGINAEKGFALLLGIRDATRSAGQSPFEPPSVFGWKGSCNINRSGQRAFGEGYISDQRLLNRGRACGELMSGLSWMEYDLAGAIGLRTGMTAAEIADKAAATVFGVTLSDGERQILARFVSTAGDGQPFQINVGQPNFVWRKLARLICMIGELPSANSK